MRAAPDDAGVDATDVAEPERPPFEPCTRDIDCVAPNGCYTPHCDTVARRLHVRALRGEGPDVLDGHVQHDHVRVLRSACPTASSTSSYDVPGVTSGCGPNPEACVAAAFPFVFVGTRDDVVAVRADDLTGKTPIKVPVVGVGTEAAAGRRERPAHLGARRGAGRDASLPAAHLAPSTSRAIRRSPTLRAHTDVVSYPYPTATGFAAPSGGLFLVVQRSGAGLPDRTARHARRGGHEARRSASAVDAGAFDASAPVVRRDDHDVPHRHRAGGLDDRRVERARGSCSIAAPSTFNLVTGAGTTAAVSAGRTSGSTPRHRPASAQTMLRAGPRRDA